MDEKKLNTVIKFPAICESNRNVIDSSFENETFAIIDDENNNTSTNDRNINENINYRQRYRRDSLPALDVKFEARKLKRQNSQTSKCCREKNKFKSSSAIVFNAKLSPIRTRLPRKKDFGTKIKSKRDPLPMKLRALPHSFWQQPNHPASFSPAPLPPLSSQRYDDTQEPQSIEGNASRESSTVSDANTELLFSLFNSLENEKKPQKRGRPKKLHRSGVSSHLREDDPCLVSSGLLPSLTPSHPQPDTPKSFNYSQMLNDLVFQL